MGGGGVGRDTDARLDEAAGLAEAIGVVVADRLSFKVRAPKAGTLFGSGQVQAIADAAEQAEAELIIVDAAVTPIQQKNLESANTVKVNDRTGRIPQIFGERAAQAEGRLDRKSTRLNSS